MLFWVMYFLAPLRENNFKMQRPFQSLLAGQSGCMSIVCPSP